MARRTRHGSNDHTRSPAVLDALERKSLELDPTIDPWEQQPGENARNYGLFALYRDTGRLRSVAQVAELSPISYAATARIARANLWVERAGRWDAEQDRLFLLQLQAERKEAARRHAKWANRLATKALAALETLNPAKVSPHALLLMLDTAAKIERAALGMDARDTAPAVSVTATATTDSAGKAAMRVEVGVIHDEIMGSLHQLVQRMTPEQIAAGYRELTAATEEVSRELDAALPAPPPQ